LAFLRRGEKQISRAPAFADASSSALRVSEDRSADRRAALELVGDPPVYRVRHRPAPRRTWQTRRPAWRLATGKGLASAPVWATLKAMIRAVSVVVFKGAAMPDATW